MTHQDPAPLTPADHLARRMFEHHLQRLGTSRSKATAAASMVHPSVARRLLPWRQRVSLWWRTR